MTKDALSDLGVTDFDAASELKTSEQVTAFLQACMEEAPEDAAFIAHALGVVARAQTRMGAIAGETGLSRESLYKALSGRRDPSFSTILKVVAGLGFRLHFVPDVCQLPTPAVGFLHPKTTNSAARQIELKELISDQVVGEHSYAASSLAESREVEPLLGHIRWAGTGAQWFSVTPEQDKDVRQ